MSTVEQSFKAPDSYFVIQGVLQKVGERLVRMKDVWGNEFGWVGVHRWTFEAAQEIGRMKVKGEWRGDIPNEAVLRRRVNYMADDEWEDAGIPRAEPKKWERTGLKHKDMNLWGREPRLELQSAYRQVQGSGQR